MYLCVLFQDAIERGLRSGELSTGMHPKALAQMLIVSLIGLTVMLKSRPDRSFIDQSLHIILSVIT